MRAVAQAAHAIAVPRITAHATRHQCQRRSQQRNNYKYGMDAFHGD
ncbi:MAG: hypothetical protein WB780_16450 [Candidatus Acidiferrales bacterium]